MYMYFFSYRARSGSTSKTIDTSVTQLSGYIQLATDSIFESFERCPLVLRQSMRLLWDRVIAKFPDNVSTCIILLYYYNVNEKFRIIVVQLLHVQYTVHVYTCTMQYMLLHVYMYIIIVFIFLHVNVICYIPLCVSVHVHTHVRIECMNELRIL